MCRYKIAIMWMCFSVGTYYAIAQQAKHVTFKGKVLDTMGRPVAGAKVTAYEMLSDGIAGNILLRPADEITTVKNGAFVLSAPPKSKRSVFFDCMIVAVKPGLALGWTEWTMREDAKANIQLGVPEKVGGVIVNEAGKPIVGAEVRANLNRIVKAADAKEKRIWLPGIEPLNELGRKTDRQGRFIFDNLPEDVSVDLLVKAEGKATTYTYQTATNEPAFKAGQTDIRITLPEEARIEGKIIDPDTGAGIAETQFAIVTTSSGLFFYRFVHTTNEDGTFSVGGLQSDRYLLRNGGFPHTYVEAESGKTKNITVQANRLSRPRGIPGVVRDPKGKPLANAVISTFPPVTEEIITDARGAFTLRAKRARRGTIYLLIRHKERNLAIVEQLDESPEELDISLAPGAILSGRILDAEGRGIPGAELSMTLQLSHPIRGSVEIGIDKSGHYEIRAVPTERTYSLTASAEGYGKLSKQIDTGDVRDERIEVEPLVLAVANLSASGIVVDEFDQPISGVRISAYGDGQPSRETLTDAKGRFTVEKVCPGQITIYADQSSPRRLRGRAEAEGGDTDVKIIVAELDERGRRIPKQPPSLMGKPLPELKGLGTNLSLDDLEGKSILVCLWDMNQRPSRNCLLRLANRAEELKPKGIIVIAVQASKVKKNELDIWTKRNRIPFPVGMIQGDENKARFSWGAQSLPWLILTDRKHKVIAEGFALQELDDKLKTN